MHTHTHTHTHTQVQMLWRRLLQTFSENNKNTRTKTRFCTGVFMTRELFGCRWRLVTRCRVPFWRRPSPHCILEWLYSRDLLIVWIVTLSLSFVTHSPFSLSLSLSVKTPGSTFGTSVLLASRRGTGFCAQKQTASTCRENMDPFFGIALLLFEMYVQHVCYSHAVLIDSLLVLSRLRSGL